MFSGGVLGYPTEGLPNVYSTVLKNNFGKWLRGRYTHSENTSKSKSAWANYHCCYFRSLVISRNIFSQKDIQNLSSVYRSIIFP